jgi:hypothetical protein
MRAMTLGVLLAACGSGSKDNPGRSSGSATPPAESPPPAIKIEEAPATASDVIYAIDRSQPALEANHFAVGGGKLYVITPNRDIVRKDLTDLAGEGQVTAKGVQARLAADNQYVYQLEDGVAGSITHSGGRISTLASGSFVDAIPGRAYVLLRSPEKLLIMPKANGSHDVIWTGKHGKHSVVADGDTFYVLDESLEAEKLPKRKILAYGYQQKPRVVLEHAAVHRRLGVAGDDIYFSGSVDNNLPAQPLWKVKKAGGEPVAASNPALGFGEYVIVNNTLYGMIEDGLGWSFAKLALTDGAKPIVIEPNAAEVNTIRNDGAHVYYSKPHEIRRVQL